jgi:hypothetical protein
MKIALEFDDKRDALLALHAQEMASVLFEIRYNLRKNIEWQMDGATDLKPQDVLDMVLELINQEFVGLDIDGLID